MSQSRAAAPACTRMPNRHNTPPLIEQRVTTPRDGIASASSNTTKVLSAQSMLSFFSASCVRDADRAADIVEPVKPPCRYRGVLPCRAGAPFAVMISRRPPEGDLLEQTQAQAVSVCIRRAEQRFFPLPSRAIFQASISTEIPLDHFPTTPTAFIPGNSRSSSWAHPERVKDGNQRNAMSLVRESASRFRVTDDRDSRDRRGSPVRSHPSSRPPVPPQSLPPQLRRLAAATAASTSRRAPGHRRELKRLRDRYRNCPRFWSTAAMNAPPRDAFEPLHRCTFESGAGGPASV